MAYLPSCWKWIFIHFPFTLDDLKYLNALLNWQSLQYFFHPFQFQFFFVFDYSTVFPPFVHFSNIKNRINNKRNNSHFDLSEAHLSTKSIIVGAPPFDFSNSIKFIYQQSERNCGMKRWQWPFKINITVGIETPSQYFDAAAKCDDTALPWYSSARLSPEEKERITIKQCKGKYSSDEEYI